MTPRPNARMRQTAWSSRARTAALAIVPALTLLALAGCDPRQALYFFQPFEPKIAAPCPSLKGKKVVVATLVVPGGSGDFVALDREFTRELTAIMKEKIRKLDLVDPDQVATWSQGNPTWTDPADLAKAFEADVAIVCEIQHFEVDNPSSPGLFQGHASVHVRAVSWEHPKDSHGRPMTEKPKEPKVIYEGDRTTDFPVTGHIVVSADVNRSGFKTRFLSLVATEVSWFFVDHAPGDNIQDTKFRAE
jgi:hypothetical protein